jgi:hypothetical protein
VIGDRSCGLLSIRRTGDDALDIDIDIDIEIDTAA